MIGKAIRTERLRQDVGQRELARRAGMTHANLVGIELERRDCLVETARRIAEALGVPLAELV